METVYHIEGMTCNGCRKQVEKSIAALEQVHRVNVSLEREEAVVATNELLDIAILRETLSSKYTITRKRDDSRGYDENLAVKLEDENSSKWRQLRPLFLILGYITAASILLHRQQWNWQEMMMDFMGLFFIVFSFFKLLDLKGFIRSFAMYDPLAARAPAYGRLYPFLEVALGLMFLLRWNMQVALMVTIVILGITTVGVTRTLRRKDTIQCACLGTALNLPMTEATFIENAIMIVMALSMLLIV